MSNYDTVTFTVKIMFVDGKVMKLHRVSGYKYDSEMGIYVVSKNGYRQFFNATHIMYIGREFDLEEKDEPYGYVLTE